MDEDTPAPESTETVEATTEEPAEPEKMTLDEYLESQKAKRPEEDNHVARTVKNEDFEGPAGRALVKEEDEGPEYILGNVLPKKGKKRNPNKKGLMNIDEFNKDTAFPTQRGGYRGRGGRGRGRGRGGYLKLDMNEFPKLG